MAHMKKARIVLNVERQCVARNGEHCSAVKRLGPLFLPVGGSHVLSLRTSLEVFPKARVACVSAVS